jgi:hypothetical protein
MVPAETIYKNINTWYSVVYRVKETTALKRYSLNSLLAGACDDDMLCEGDKEVREGIA